MGDRIFSGIRILIIWCSVLNIFSAHDSGSGGGGGGGGTSQLDVVISYETENYYVEEFFKNQLTAKVFEEFSKCNVIRWNFMPCTTSSMVNGVLVCRKGEIQCKYDKIHACAATLYQKNQQQVGKFVICSFNCKNEQQCACQNEMKWELIDQCVKDKKGDGYCNAFFDRIINDSQTELVPGVRFGSKYNATLNDDAVLDFKGVLCTQLKNNNLQCSVCNKN